MTNEGEQNETLQKQSGWPWFWVSLALTGLAVDHVSTAVFMLKHGPASEAHPVVRYVSEITGPLVGPLLGFIGKSLAFGLITFLFPRTLPYLALIIFAATSYAFVINMSI